MTKQEAIDNLQKRIAGMKETTWTMLRELNRATPLNLPGFGYRGLSNAEAMRKCFNQSVTDIETLIRQFEKQFPD